MSSTDGGYLVNHKRVARLMRANGLGIKPRRRYVRTTDSSHDLPVYPNLYRNMIPARPDMVWVADFTYILVPEGEIVQIHHLFSLEHYQEGASFILSGKDGALRHGVASSEEKETGRLDNISGMTFREVEVLLIRQALEESHGNAVQAARKLGLSRSQFRTKLSQLQIR